MPQDPTYKELLRRIQELEQKEAERLRSEDTLKESERKYQLLAENIDDIIWTLNAELTHYTYISPSVTRLGYTPEEFLSKPFEAFIVPKYHEHIRNAVLDRLKKEREGKRENKVGRWELEFVGKDSETIHVESITRPLRDENGVFQGLLGVTRDITERKKAELKSDQHVRELAALQELGLIVNASLSFLEVSSAALRGVMEAVRPDIAFFFLHDGDHLVLQEVLPSEVLHTLGEIPKHKVGECICGLAVSEGRLLYSRDIHNDFRCTWNECKKAGIKSFASLPMKNGEETIGVIGLASLTDRDFEAQAGFLETLAHQISLALTNARLYESIQHELTERQKAEESLYISEGKYRQLIETTDTGYVILDEQGRVTDANQKYVYLTGHGRIEDIVGRQVLEWTAPHDHERNALEVQKCIKQGFVRNLELDYLTPSGQIIPVEINATVLRDSGPFRILSLCRDITERKRAEEALRESEERMRFLVKNSSDSLVIVNADGSQRYVSPAAERITGFRIAELEGRTLDTLIHQDDLKNIQAAWKEAIEHPEKTVTVQYRHIHKTKGWIFSEAIAQSFLAEPAINGVIASVRDITERKKAEETIDNSNKLLQTIINTVPTRIFFKDLDLRYMGCNNAFSRDAGVECPEDLIGKDDYELAWKEQAELFRADDRRVIENAVPKLSYDEQLTTQEGHLIWVRTSKVPLRNEANRIIGVLGMYEDITERRRSEDTLRLRESCLSAIIENQPGLLWLKDTEGRFLSVNTKFSKSCGLNDPKLLVGKTDFDIWSRELAERYTADDAKVLQSGKPLVIEELISDKGEMLWFETFKTPVFNDQGTVIGTTGYAHDITERKKAENALRESEDKFRLTFDFSPDSININRLDDGLFVDINEGFTRITGYNWDDVMGKSSLELDIWENPADRKKMIQGLQEKGFFENLETQFRRKDGKLLNGLMSSRVINLKGVPHLISITRDITERKIHQKEQMKIDKLESLGILAGGIAHDFNNILTGIMGNISFAKVYLDTAHKSYKPLAEAEKATERAGDLAHQLLTFARGGEPNKKVVSPQNLMRETLTFILHGSNVKGTIDIPDSIHAIEADEGQISQVFQNIIINATQAMPEGGILTVIAKNEELYKNNPLSLPPGPYIHLTFTDQGRGISDKDLKKIFDPYFTTKSTGIGLGLSSVHSIVSRHGGHIGVSSTVGKGTTFTIHLPSLGKAYTEYQAEVTGQATCEHKGGSILVMDDDDMIRDLASSMLTYLGYQVTVCASGEEAIELYRKSMESGTPFTLVIMDLTIPGGLGGKEAADQILSFFPKARLAVSSGYSNDPIMSNYRDYGFSGAISKPYSIREFEKVLGSLLAH